MKLDLTNQSFGRLTVLEYSYTKKYIRYWKCQCSCPAKTIRYIPTGRLQNPNGTKSCGCLQKEVASIKNKKHGLIHTKVYRAWNAMIQRCNNPNTDDFNNWGGRGIKVCAEWLNFENFYRDMGDPPSSKYSIDRIDNNDNYR